MAALEKLPRSNTPWRWVIGLLAACLIELSTTGAALAQHIKHTSSASGAVHGVPGSGRSWVVQESPFILHSDQASPISAPSENRRRSPEVIQPLSAMQPHQAVPDPTSASQLGAGFPQLTLDPEKWLADTRVSDAVIPPTHSTDFLDAISADPDDLSRQLSFRQDLGNAWKRTKSDVAAVLQPRNMLILAVVAGGAIAIHQDVDDQVRESTLHHPQRWGEASDALGYLGEINVQAPILAGFYLWSLKTQNEDLHDFMTTAISAYTINGVSTMLLKVAVNSDRPSADYNDGHYGFPSFHTSSTFTLASVLNEYYGWEVGVPAYLVAGMVGWSRIDNRDHDLSDVMFGAALGYVIGTSIAKHHLTGDSRVLMMPWNDPQNGAFGVAWEWWY